MCFSPNLLVTYINQKGHPYFSYTREIRDYVSADMEYSISLSDNWKGSIYRAVVDLEKAKRKYFRW